jgi:hypothetical protein
LYLKVNNKSMKKLIFPIIFLLLIPAIGFSQAIQRGPIITPAGKGKVNTRIDNMGYWNEMLRLGYIKPSPYFPAAKADSTSSIIDIPGIGPQDSPDVPVTNNTGTTQSENSVFIDPESEEFVLNSNNSTSWTGSYAQDTYGADGLLSFTWGQSWSGAIQGAGGTNNGDPTTAIGLNGWYYVGKISNDGGQSIAYSKDKGATWTNVVVKQGPTSVYGLLDKNHLWIDNSPDSPHKGNLYDAWTNFITLSPDTNQVQVSRSTDGGLTWSGPLTVSFAANALKLNHGVNVHTGPDGNVYMAWSIYDTWPSDETAIGFCKSVDGGAIFTPATRIINNIKGIRASMTGKNMRVNAFPSMAVDISTGPDRGTIYLVWTNIGFPGINTGTDMDVYMIRSTDEGETWSTPIRVNQDPAGLGKQHYFPWITCDPVTGGLCVVYYDDRNVSSTQCETYVSWSYDGGLSWSDLKVSDVSFTPSPIPGLALNYFGDYIGIQSRNMKVYPAWTDNRGDGRAMTYVSPFDLGPNPNQPWVVYHSHELELIPSKSRLNMNTGDSLYLTLGLKNTGDQPADALVALVTSPSPYIRMTDSIESYGQMDAGEVKVVPQGYSFKVSDTIPDNLLVRFNIKVIGSDSSWSSHFTVESHAPALRISSLILLDTAGGNGNKRLDPGETVIAKIATANMGDFACYQTYGILSAATPWITIEQDSVFLDTLNPGQGKSAIFTLHVDPDAPVGAAAGLFFTLRSGLYHTERLFPEQIGLIVEDWETNTFTKFEWQAGGVLPWTLNNQNPWEGIWCVQSARIYDYQNTQLILNYASSADDSISFRYKTSTEDDYDFLMFYIDDILQGQWSGEIPWRRAAFPVAAGQHQFKWVYQKDLAYFIGQDRVWLDFIAFPPPVLPEVDPGPDDTICAGQLYLLTATASGYDSLKWTTTGDGRYSNDTLLQPAYTPGNEDIVNGSVKLKLTGYGLYGSYTKSMNLTIGAIPVAAISLFPNDTVCAGQTILLSADTSSGGFYHWTPGGITTPEVFMDTLLTGGIGSYLGRLTVTSQEGCTNRDSLMITFMACAGMEDWNEESTLNISPNPCAGMFSLTLRTLKPEIAGITITSASGVTVYKKEDLFVSGPLTMEINLEDQPNGIYLLKLRTGDRTQVRRLIISR